MTVISRITMALPGMCKSLFPTSMQMGHYEDIDWCSIAQFFFFLLVVYLISLVLIIFFTIDLDCFQASLRFL